MFINTLFLTNVKIQGSLTFNRICSIAYFQNIYNLISFVVSYFQNISKTAETILIKKKKKSPGTMAFWSTGKTFKVNIEKLSNPRPNTVLDAARHNIINIILKTLRFNVIGKHI